jgi:hypothetical protein
MARAKSSVLNDSQEQFVDGIMNGMTPAAAAKLIEGNKNGAMMMNVPKVQAEIAKARQQIEDVTLLRRVDTIDGILDGIQMAKMLGDPANVIKGWVEIGKILGHYAPEVKKIQLSDEDSRLRHRLTSMSDEELYRLSRGQTIENESTS